jgi:hypothetical protein
MLANIAVAIWKPALPSAELRALGSFLPAATRSSMRSAS